MSVTEISDKDYRFGSTEKSIPKLELVEWLDSCQPVSSWRYLHDAPEIEVSECVSVGWVVGETDIALMLAPNIGNFGSDDSAQASGFFRIPKVAITRRVGLEEVICSSSLASSLPVG